MLKINLINQFYPFTDLREPVSFELLNHREEFKIGMTSGVLETKQGAVLDREEQSRYRIFDD